MSNILEQLADHARFRVEEAKKIRSLDEIRNLAEAAAAEKDRPADFEEALSGGDLAFICECKKASPSKGLIAADFRYLETALAYEEADAAAISVLTEPKWFLGSERYLQEIASKVKIPVLRKDFTIDEYMIYETRVLGASAVLLICSILDEGRLRSYRQLCDEIGLSALVEAHDEAEIDTAVRAGARIIGVNNRNLKDFSVDTGNTARLRALVPEGTLFVAESGVSGPEDVKRLKEAGADAVLIGEALMRAPDKKKKLMELKGEL